MTGRENEDPDAAARESVGRALAQIMRERHPGTVWELVPEPTSDEVVPSANRLDDDQEPTP